MWQVAVGELAPPETALLLACAHVPGAAATSSKKVKVAAAPKEMTRPNLSLSEEYTGRPQVPS